MATNKRGKEIGVDIHKPDFDRPVSEPRPEKEIKEANVPIGCLGLLGASILGVMFITSDVETVGQVFARAVEITTAVTGYAGEKVIGIAGVGLATIGLAIEAFKKIKNR